MIWGLGVLKREMKRGGQIIDVEDKGFGVLGIRLENDTEFEIKITNKKYRDFKEGEWFIREFPELDIQKVIRNG